MEQSNNTDKLLEELAADAERCGNISISAEEFPEEESEKKNLIRSLMNIRMPGEVSEELLNLQNKYLQEELAAKGIVALSDIPTIKEQYNSAFFHGSEMSPAGNRSYADKISLWQGDITRLKVGAIVNAANSRMLGCFVPCHRCIDNAIHSAAGMQLREECSHIMNSRRIKYGRRYEEPTGTATLTKAYNLPCDYVIHTVGPICYNGLNEGLCQDLRNCYENVLKCCVENGIKSVAFCCISTGEFHFPNKEASEIAWETVTAFLEKHSDCMERVIFNVFTDKDREIYEACVSDIQMP